jgi:hypothetical protein
MMGGFAYYDLYRPISENNIFINVTAPYGPIFASYPVKVNIIGEDSANMVIENAASGQVYGQEIKMSLVDHDNQVVSTNSASKISIVAVKEGTKVIGSSTESVVSGVATFKSIIFVAPPGSQDVEYIITSNGIDINKIRLQYGVDSIQNPIKVSFRYCKPGEIMHNNECRK